MENPKRDSTKKTPKTKMTPAKERWSCHLQRKTVVQGKCIRRLTWLPERFKNTSRDVADVSPNHKAEIEPFIIATNQAKRAGTTSLTLYSTNKCFVDDVTKKILNKETVDESDDEYKLIQNVVNDINISLIYVNPNDLATQDKWRTLTDDKFVQASSANINGIEDWDEECKTIDNRVDQNKEENWDIEENWAKPIEVGLANSPAENWNIIQPKNRREVNNLQLEDWDGEIKASENGNQTPQVQNYIQKNVNLKANTSKEGNWDEDPNMINSIEPQELSEKDFKPTNFMPEKFNFEPRRKCNFENQMWDEDDDTKDSKRKWESEEFNSNKRAKWRNWDDPQHKKTEEWIPQRKLENNESTESCNISHNRRGNWDRGCRSRGDHGRRCFGRGRRGNRGMRGGMNQPIEVGLTNSSAKNWNIMQPKNIKEVNNFELEDWDAEIKTNESRNQASQILNMKANCCEEENWDADSDMVNSIKTQELSDCKPTNFMPEKFNYEPRRICNYEIHIWDEDDETKDSKRKLESEEFKSNKTAKWRDWDAPNDEDAMEYFPDKNYEGNATQLSSLTDTSRNETNFGSDSTENNYNFWQKSQTSSRWNETGKSKFNKRGMWRNWDAPQDDKTTGWASQRKFENNESTEDCNITHNRGGNSNRGFSSRGDPGRRSFGRGRRGNRGMRAGMNQWQNKNRNERVEFGARRGDWNRGRGATWKSHEEESWNVNKEPENWDFDSKKIDEPEDWDLEITKIDEQEQLKSSQI